METENRKCVMILWEDLPAGVQANTAGILGITLGKHVPELVGPDVSDKSGLPHLGIIGIPVPVLKADRERLKSIRQQLCRSEYAEVITVDFSDVAQSCNIYEMYMDKVSNSKEDDFTYYGLGLCGPKKLINKLSGNLPLLR